MPNDVIRIFEALSENYCKWGKSDTTFVLNFRFFFTIQSPRIGPNFQEVLNIFKWLLIYQKLTKTLKIIGQFFVWNRSSIEVWNSPKFCLVFGLFWTSTENSKKLFSKREQRNIQTVFLLGLHKTKILFEI